MRKHLKVVLRDPVQQRDWSRPSFLCLKESSHTLDLCGICKNSITHGEISIWLYALVQTSTFEGRDHFKKNPLWGKETKPKSCHRTLMRSTWWTSWPWKGSPSTTPSFKRGRRYIFKSPNVQSPGVHPLFSGPLSEHTLQQAPDKPGAVTDA